MKFVADVMLGSLARLMRFHGYDVEYSNTADDETLRKRSVHRILLTKDRALSKRIRKGRSYLVQNTGGKDQLQEIQKQFPVRNTSSRCVECNSKLRSIRKEKVEHLVPPFVYKKYNQFFSCPSCMRIYWQGTHFERMLRMLE
ncbi:Mut7-C RNAse domain-containing protein [bacterium]|nr:Mut7-C RNAse domain-containing protein [bacterium]MCI0604648.1 Mut7-C RNAse domain-containing protein [bacterium]